MAWAPRASGQSLLERVPHAEAELVATPAWEQGASRAARARGRASPTDAPGARAAGVPRTPERAAAGPPLGTRAASARGAHATGVRGGGARTTAADAVGTAAVEVAMTTAARVSAVPGFEADAG